MKQLHKKIFRYVLIPILSLLVSTGTAQAQSKGIAAAVTFNSMTENIYSSANTYTSSTTTYFDGLGREVQTQIGFPNHNNIVTLTDYDSYGRVSKNYLPCPTSTLSGYDPNVKATQGAYYQSHHNSVYGYSQTVYDNTTKSSVIETKVCRFRSFRWRFTTPINKKNLTIC